MDDFKDLEIIYLSLEETEVLRDIGQDWSSDDLQEFGLDFQSLLELRSFVLSQDYSRNLGFLSLIQELFPERYRSLLTEEEIEIWSSIEESLDPTVFSIAMCHLVTGNFKGIKEWILEGFLLDELDSVESAKELRKNLLDNFKAWQSSRDPEKLKKSLPQLASVELAKLRSLRT
jgi:hypothetical protein